jgi:hypothetical protein
MRASHEEQLVWLNIANHQLHAVLDLKDFPEPYPYMDCGVNGDRHSLEVTAETLYEAVAQALAAS